MARRCLVSTQDHKGEQSGLSIWKRMLTFSLALERFRLFSDFASVTCFESRRCMGIASMSPMSSLQMESAARFRCDFS